jgi:hypothetical protein
MHHSKICFIYIINTYVSPDDGHNNDWNIVINTIW